MCMEPRILFYERFGEVSIFLKFLDDKRVRILLDWTVDLFFDRDISRLKVLHCEAPKEYKELDEVDDVW